MCGAVALAGCVPSLLYVRNGPVGTHGEIPRDGRGEPLWSAIRQAQPATPTPQMLVGGGIPIIPPHD